MCIRDSRYFFLDVNELHRLVLEPAGLRIVRTARLGDRLRVELRAEHYARCVRLNILDMRADYSDNYFDLDAGSSRVITIDLQESSEPLFALDVYKRQCPHRAPHSSGAGTGSSDFCHGIPVFLYVHLVL